jgi:hypothetical protein
VLLQLRYNNLYLSGTVTNDGSGGMSIDTSGNVTFNEGSIDADFRVESDTNTNALFVQGSDGHIGVGTGTLPRTLNIYGASNGTIGLDNPVSGSPQIAFKQNGTDKAYVSYWDAFDTLALSDGSGNGLHFKPSTGNVGIGTSSPSAKLTVIEDVSRSALTGTGVGQIHISGGTTPADNDVSSITFSTNNTTTASSIIGSQLTNNGSNLFFGTSGNYAAGVNNTAMFINYSGNVGIGTSSPSTPLHIKTTGSSGTETEVLRLETTGTNDGSGVTIDMRTSHINTQIAMVDGSGSYDGNIVFRTASGSLLATPTEKMRIHSSGAVTIGKATTSTSDAGFLMYSTGAIASTRASDVCIIAKRLNNDGDNIQIFRDGSRTGIIGSLLGNSMYINAPNDSGAVFCLQIMQR